MRVLFSIVIILGLLLTGLSIFEIRVVSEYRSKVHDVQSWLAAWQQKQADEDRRKGITYTATSLAYQFGESVEGLDHLERGWLAVAGVGGALFTLGIAGVIIGRRASFQKSPPNTALEPTRGAP